MIERQWCPVDYDLARGFRAIVDSPTWYYYDDKGNPTRIVTEDADYPDQYTATRFKYDQGRRVAGIAWVAWAGAACPCFVP